MAIRLLIIFLLNLPLTALAETFCVGTTSEFRSALQTAFNNGEDDDIRLRPGTYLSSEGTGLIADLEVDRSLVISGGWSDFNGIGCFSQFLSNPFDTVIDGEDQSSGIAVSASDIGSTASLAIRNLSIVQAAAGSTTAGVRIAGQGGFAGEILIDRVRFAGNHGSDGAAIWADGGNKVTIRNSVFQFNRTAGGGGTISILLRAEDQGLYFINNTVISNGSDLTSPSGSATSGLSVSLMQSGDDIPQALVANNLFWDNDLADMFFSFSGGIKYVYNNNYQQLLGSVQNLADNLSLPPRLSPLLLDYTPEADSPLIDRGLPAPALRGGVFLLDWSYGPQDFLPGFPGRVNGDRVDIGAVESPFVDRLFNDRFQGGFGPFGCLIDPAVSNPDAGRCGAL